MVATRNNFSQNGTNMRNLDLDLLRTFVVIVDCETFTVAAQHLHRTQSAVTQQMQRLESQVGAPVFEREGRHKRLTTHGMRLLKYARQILMINDEALRALNTDDLDGNLRIGAPLDVADTILPVVLTSIARWSPHLKLEIHVGRSPFLMDALKRDEIDLTISTRHDPAFDGVILRHSPTVWLCSADYHHDRSQPLPLILADELSIFRKIALTALEEAGVPWRINYLAPSLLGIKAALRSGLGVTARSIELLGPDMRVLGIADGLPVLPDAHYSLWKQRNPIKPQTSLVYEMLRNTLSLATGKLEHPHSLPLRR